jgi:tRNA(Ile)-lysidine synthase
MMDHRSTHDVWRAVSRARAEHLPGRWGIACSGGADSMALAHACVSMLGITECSVFHVDHGLSAQSAAVAQMVAKWCAAVGVEFVQRRIELSPGAGIEERARDARYQALREIAASDVRWIVTAHTASDQAETVLMRLIRGTGIHGLAAMAPVRDDILRPLLRIQRRTLEQYLAEHKLPVWHDPMNQDMTLFRSRVRHQVLPMLTQENPQFAKALCDLADQAQAWRQDVASLALPCELGQIRAMRSQQRDVWWQQVLIEAGLPVSKSAHAALQRALQFDAAGSRRLDIAGGALIVEYGMLRLQAGTMDAQSAPAPLNVSLIPAQPYQVRTWQPGDRMQPARLQGKSRKLSDLFIDAKVPAAKRRLARVVVVGYDIIWCEHIGAAWQVEIAVDVAQIHRSQ